MTGKFIVLEGIDKSGKTTLSRSIQEKLVENKKEVFYTHEPTEFFDSGLNIIDHLKRNEYLILTAMFMRDRLNHNGIIEEHLKMGKYVICDRYTLSTLAYQGVYFRDHFENEDEFFSWIGNFLNFSHMEPDLTIFIDFNEKMFTERRSEESDLIMFEKEEYLRDVYSLYNKAIERKLFSKSFKKIDGKLDREKILEIAMECIEKL